MTYLVYINFGGDTFEVYVEAANEAAAIAEVKTGASSAMKRWASFFC